MFVINCRHVGAGKSCWLVYSVNLNQGPTASPITTCLTTDLQRLTRSRYSVEEAQSIKYSELHTVVNCSHFYFFVDDELSDDIRHLACMKPTWNSEEN